MSSWLKRSDEWWLLKHRIHLSRGGFRGKGGRTSLEEFDPLSTHRVPLCTILKYPFLAAHLAPIYINFKGERAPKNAIFCLKFFKNCLKTFLGLKFWPKTGSFLCFGKARKIILIDLKKVDKIRPPRRKYEIRPCF